MGAFDFMGTTNPQTGSFQMDPNFIQILANMGSAVSQGKGAGEVLGNAASAYTRNKAMQQAGGGMINNLQIPPVTPKGQAGPDSVTHNVTADGVTTTIKQPSERNLNTFGTSVPPESQAVQPKVAEPTQLGVTAPSPFWQALLNQYLQQRQ